MRWLRSSFALSCKRSTRRWRRQSRLWVDSSLVGSRLFGLTVSPASDPNSQNLTPRTELLVGRMSTCEVQLANPAISNIVRAGASTGKAGMAAFFKPLASPILPQHLSVVASDEGVVSVTDHSSNASYQVLRITLCQPLSSS